MDAANDVGRAAEQRALSTLLAAGLVLIKRNFRSRRGEIDLVMREGGVLVFVEVRLRSSARHGGALSSLDPAKCRRLLAAAEIFLARNPRYAINPARFDLVAFDGPAAPAQWIKGAFCQEHIR